MFCKWCGMESAATDLCSWCHRPLSATTTTPEAAPPASENPVRSAPAARPLIEEEPEEEAEEDSPLVAGITAESSARRPAPNHRPAWAPVPRAGAASASPPAAPAVKAPEASPTPEPAVARPVIGVRRPGGAPAPNNDASATNGSAPAANAGGSAPIGVRRPVGPVPAPIGTKRPPIPATARPVPSNRPTAPAPVPTGARPASSDNVVPASHDPFVHPAAATVNNAPDASVRTAVPVARAGVAPVRQSPSALVVEEAEAGGLADGIAAGKRPVGVPALGTFTATNSKYYTGQVVDPASGTHYDSATGQATSSAPAQRAEDVVLQWDDPVSTPRHIGRFAMAFAGMLIGMAGLVHLIPDYAAIPLVVILFAAGILLPVMKAVPFQSDDSDDLVWLVLLTLLFGPSIGLLIYSIKAFLLHDMNIAVLGMLAISFLGYLVFQLAAPLPPVTPDAGEAFFNMMKLAPPWTQVTRYGYAALLYNWVGIVTMVGWFVGNVFRKLDE